VRRPRNQRQLPGGLQVKRAFWYGLVLACVIALYVSPSSAHVMSAGKGTVNLVGAEVFTVLSVPVSALSDVDDNRDGVLDAEEFQRHLPALQSEIDRRLMILDGEVVAKTVRLDLMLSPEHDAAVDRAAEIVALKHAAFTAPPVDLRVRCDLFGQQETQQEIKITATRQPTSGTKVETEEGVLRRRTPEQAFFSTVHASPSGGWMVISAISIALTGLVMVQRRRPRRVT